MSTNVAAQRYGLGIPSTVFTGETIIGYRISDNEAFLVVLSSDSTRVLTGVLRRQY
jgi:hypothetical protein